MQGGDFRESYHNYTFNPSHQETKQQLNNYIHHGGHLPTHSSSESFGAVPQRHSTYNQENTSSNHLKFESSAPQPLPREYHFTVNGRVSFNQNASRSDYSHGSISVFPTNLNQLYSTEENKDFPGLKPVMKCEISSQTEVEKLSADPGLSGECKVLGTDTVVGGGDDEEDTGQSQKMSEAESSSDIKPSMSYIALIGKAILESSEKRLNLGSIYSWIESTFPYYVNRGQGWRNSVRHNLSLNECFIKAGRCEDGKGNYWAVHPANLQDFMRGDFRQRRRSRKRGRKKNQEMNIYNMHNGYLSPPPVSSFSDIGLNPVTMTTAMSPLYSPYTEAERRAYKLDEALRQQGINSHFWNWATPSNYTGINGQGVSSAMYGSTSTQWSSYPDNSPSTMYAINPR
ncbi:hypothetical protein SNE40_014962 [Patella caerulea]